MCLHGHRFSAGRRGFDWYKAHMCAQGLHARMHAGWNGRIVSNPPVHAGIPDCFSVVEKLAMHAADSLKPDGKLWIVAQEQVSLDACTSLNACTSS